MKKPIIISIFSAIALLGGIIPAANAQVYGYPPSLVYTGGYGAPMCLSLTTYMSLGSTDAMTGGQVTELQQFLNRTGYLSGVSGTFDTGTYGAVINFQNAHGIPGTGTVGPETRAVITQQSCGGYNGGYNNGYTGSTNGCSWIGNSYVCGYTTYPSGYNNYYPYNSNCGYTSFNNYYSNCGYYNYVHINSLSNSYGYNGTTITVSGTGFSSTGNTVHFGSYTMTNVPSYNGTTLVFTVPTNCSAGTYSVSVTNAAGMTSNTLTFQAYGYNNYNNYPYNNYCYNGTFNNCNNPYNYNNGSISLSSISGPSNVQVNTTNTWSITAYNSNGYYNGQTTISVNWGDNYGSNANDTRTFYSNGSQSFSFAHTYVYPGTYTIRMTATNSNGYSSYQSYTVYVSPLGYITRY